MLVSGRDGGGERLRRRASKQARIRFENNDLATQRACACGEFEPDKSAPDDNNALCAAEPGANGETVFERPERQTPLDAGKRQHAGARAGCQNQPVKSQPPAISEANAPLSPLDRDRGDPCDLLDA